MPSLNQLFAVHMLHRMSYIHNNTEMHNDDCPKLSCPLEGRGAGRGSCGISKKGWPKRNSEARCFPRGQGV